MMHRVNPETGNVCGNRKNIVRVDRSRPVAFDLASILERQKRSDASANDGFRLHPTVRSARWIVEVLRCIYLGRHVLLTVTAAFTLLVAPAVALNPPTFSPQTAIFGRPVQTVTLSASPGASIYFTLDGSVPTTSSKLYSAPITVAQSELIQAIAFQSGTTSSVAANYYLVDPNAFPVPTSGLQFWYRSDFGTTTNGSSLAAWSDASGNGNTSVQGTPSAQPTLVNGALNDWSVVSFNGSSNYLILPSGFQTLGAGFTSFVIARPTAANSVTVFQLGNAGPSDTVGIQTNGSTATLLSYNGTTPSSITSGSGTIAQNNYQLIQGTQSGSSSGNIAVNALSVLTAALGNASNANRSTNFIGTDASQSAYYQGSIAEILFWNRQLSLAEIAAVQGYALNRYQVFQANSTPPPIISVPSGTLQAPMQVAISARAGCQIFVTTNGSTPTTSSPQYSAPLLVAYSQTIKAIAVSNGNTSSVVSATYTLDSTQWPAPSSTDSTPLQLNLQLPTTGISP